MQMAEHTARVATSSFMKRIGLSPYAETNRAKASGLLAAFKTAIRCIQRRQQDSTEKAYGFIYLEIIRTACPIIGHSAG